MYIYKYIAYRFIQTYLRYFNARPVSVQAGPPSASVCPLHVHSELDELNQPPRG